MSTDLLKTLQILTDFVVETVRGHLRILAILVVLLSVEEPVGDLVLTWVRDDRDNSIDL